MKRLILILFILIAGTCFAQQKTEVEQVKIQLATMFAQMDATDPAGTLKVKLPDGSTGYIRVWAAQ
jgi:hypothetical protein